MNERRYITLHLIANNPQELSMMTMATQNLWGASIEFFDFNQLKNGKHICWFRIPVSMWNDRQASSGEENN